MIFAGPDTVRLLGAWAPNGAAAEPYEHPRPVRTDRGQLPGGLAARQDRVCTHLRTALDFWRRQGDMPNQRDLRDALRINSQTACDLVRALRAMPGADREPETMTSG